MQDQKVIGILLCGAGHLDGSSIPESMLTQLALEGRPVEFRCYAPRLPARELDHSTKAYTGAIRDTLTESSRLTRRPVLDLETVSGAELDGWIVPGGYGTLRTLSNFDEAGSGAQAAKDVARILREALAAHVPIGTIGCAAVLLAVATKRSGPFLRLTVGHDVDLARSLHDLGATEIACAGHEICRDERYRVASTPGTLLDLPLDTLRTAIDDLVDAVLEWA